MSIKIFNIRLLFLSLRGVRGDILVCIDMMMGAKRSTDAHNPSMRDARSRQKIQ